MLLTVYQLGAVATLVWTVFRLVRAPRDVPLWAVTGLAVCWAAASPATLAADGRLDILGVAPIVFRLVQLVLVMTGAYCLLCFFLFSALDTARARRRAGWYALPLAVTVAVQGALVRSVPAGADTQDFTVTGVMLLFVAAIPYMVFALATSWVWTRRYARRAEPRLARGLRIASLGQAAIALADLLYAPVLLVRWAGDTAPVVFRSGGAFETVLGFTCGVLLPSGVVLFFVGISYKSVSMRVAAVGVWWQHLLAYRRLRPLWTALHRHFPENSLGGAPTGLLGDVLNPRAVHRRYYRRVIECRDGLVHISPYLAAVRQSGAGGAAEAVTASALARQLRQALGAYAAGEPVTTTAVPVIVPTQEGLEADVRELVALSKALRAP